MNIFNYLKSLFSRNNKYPVIRINNISPNNNLIKTVKPAVLNYAQQSNIQRGMYIAPEYDLYEIHKVCDIESIVRRAFTKKEDLMFKEGYCYKSTNIKFAQYIKTRFNQMAFATGIPHTELLKRISRSLIHTSNAFLVKVRDPKASGGSIRRTADGKIVKPIAGYFPAAPETMRVDINANTGAIQGWQQLLPGGLYKEFKPEDVIHFTRDRREGFLFGIPQLVPVIDDIRALRQLEEDIEIMLHQHIFPTFQYTVGTETAPAGYTEDGQKEIDIVKSTIDIMPTEGVIITPERHKIESIRSDVAVDANNYLIHFKKRILAGLGVSSIDIGEADCYDEETETLTENGWKKHNEIDHLSERIATFNPDTQQIEFNLANSKYEGMYKGCMVNFTGKHLDIKVTPHHEMWVAPKIGKKPLLWQKVYAGDLLDGKFSEFYMLEPINPVKNEFNILTVEANNISFDYYIGNIYCYNVPNHLFVTRRNGKVTIQGNTSNKSTSFTMSKAIMDSVKAIQADLEEQWSQYVIVELLLESTFDDINILDDNDKVNLSFYEIDLMNKIDKEKHAIELFKANGLTFDEFRTELGKEPILLPENPEDQDHTKSPRWFNTYWKVFEEPTLLIKAIDEGYLASTYALASTPSSSVTSQQINYGQQLVAKTIQQEKQVKRQDSIIKYTSEIDNLFNDIKTMDINKDNLSYLKSIIRTFTTDLSNKLSINCVSKCTESFQIYTSLLDTDLIQIKVANNEINKRIDFFIKRLLDSIIYSIDKKIINGIITKDNLQNIFDVSKYRLNLIYNTEIIKSDNYGVVLGIKHLNHYGIKLVNNNIDACDLCKSLNNKQYHHSLLTLENLPPFHPHSRTTVESIIANKD